MMWSGLAVSLARGEGVLSVGHNREVDPLAALVAEESDGWMTNHAPDLVRRDTVIQ
jgi:hypothetical protein